ncbi:Ubiquitin-protein ligase, partial [Blyttiomyces sp. JEL0837]
GEPTAEQQVETSIVQSGTEETAEPEQQESQPEVVPESVAEPETETATEPTPVVVEETVDTIKQREQSVPVVEGKQKKEEEVEVMAETTADDAAAHYDDEQFEEHVEETVAVEVKVEVKAEEKTEVAEEVVSEAPAVVEEVVVEVKVTEAVVGEEKEHDAAATEAKETETHARVKSHESDTHHFESKSKKTSAGGAVKSPKSGTMSPKAAATAKKTSRGAPTTAEVNQYEAELEMEWEPVAEEEQQQDGGKAVGAFRAGEKDDGVDADGKPKIRQGTGLSRPSKVKAPPVEDPFAWRHYHTFHPVCNKLLAKRWDELSRNKHLNKLSKAKKGVCDDPPPRYFHLERNLKKAQMEKERQSEIQRDNLILVEKMAHIMRVETISAPPKKWQARLDLVTRGHEATRKQQRQKIHSKNLAILLRLESCKSDYDHIKRQEETIKRLTYLKNLSAFPQRYITMVKEEMERNSRHRAKYDAMEAAKESTKQADGTVNQHDRHHWHNSYGGQPVGDTATMFGFGGTKVAISTQQQEQANKGATGTVKPPPRVKFATPSSKKKPSERAKVAPKDQKILEGTEEMPEVPPLPSIKAGSEQLTREASPLSNTAKSIGEVEEIIQTVMDEVENHNMTALAPEPPLVVQMAHVSSGRHSAVSHGHAADADKHVSLAVARAGGAGAEGGISKMNSGVAITQSKAASKAVSKMASFASAAPAEGVESHTVKIEVKTKGTVSKMQSFAGGEGTAPSKAISKMNSTVGGVPASKAISKMNSTVGAHAAPSKAVSKMNSTVGVPAGAQPRASKVVSKAQSFAAASPLPDGPSKALSKMNSMAPVEKSQVASKAVSKMNSTVQNDLASKGISKAPSFTSATSAANGEAAMGSPKVISKGVSKMSSFKSVAEVIEEDASLILSASSPKVSSAGSARAPLPGLKEEGGSPPRESSPLAPVK